MIDGCCEVGPYRRGANPIWSFVDLNGLQCDDTFYMWVLENEIPYIPAKVYHKSTGEAWESPIQFYANGTLPNDIYFDPEKVYKLEIRQAVGTNPPSQSDPLIYRIEDYSPITSGGSGSGDVNSSPTTNQITNPQFSIVRFSPEYDAKPLNNPDVIEIAPGWFLDLVGSGNLTLQQVPLNLLNPTNAPYALRIVLSGGWTQAILRQRFDENGYTWADKFVASSVTARIEGSPQTLTGRLETSMGEPIAELFTHTLGNEFVEFTEVTEVLAPTMSGLPPNAAVDFNVYLPTNGDIYLTSFQLISSAQNTQFFYEEDTIERQNDNMFHYYAPMLESMPIASYLVGWDFGMNPMQFAPTASSPDEWGPYATGSNTSNYVWDQTIIYQNSDSGFVVEKSGNGALNITTDTNNVRLALIQYIEADKAKQLLCGEMSVNVACKKVIGVNRRGSVQLFYTRDVNLPDMNTNNSIVQSLNNDGTLSTTNANGTWIEVPRGNLGNAYFYATQAPQNEFVDSMVSGFRVSESENINTITYAAIVVGFPEMDINESIEIHSISLCAGEIATRPAPMSFNQTLADCERYYKKSYDIGSYAGDAVAQGALVRPMSNDVPYDSGLGNIVSGGMKAAFSIEFDISQMSDNQNVTLYSTDGTIDSTSMRVVGQATSETNVASSEWTLIKSRKCLAFLPNNQTKYLTRLTQDADTPVTADLHFHYISDSRLGIV